MISQPSFNMSFNMENLRNQYQNAKRRIEAIETSASYQQIVRDQNLRFQVAIARPNSALYKGLRNDQDLGDQIQERFKSLKQKIRDSDPSPMYKQLREDRAFVQEVETKLPKVSASATIPDGVRNVLERAMERRAMRNKDRHFRARMRAEKNDTHTADPSTADEGTCESVLEGLPMAILQQMFELIRDSSDDSDEPDPLFFHHILQSALNSSAEPRPEPLPFQFSQPTQNSPTEPRPDPLFFHHILENIHNSAAQLRPGPLPRRGSPVRERPTPDWVQHLFQDTPNSSDEPGQRRGSSVRERPSPDWDFS